MLVSEVRAGEGQGQGEGAGVTVPSAGILRAGLPPSHEIASVVHVTRHVTLHSGRAIWDMRYGGLMTVITRRTILLITTTLL